MPAADLSVPVVLLVFNRADLTARVLERVRAVRPRKMFVVADGPRPGHPHDVENCRRVREVIDAGIDWPCDLVRDYAAENLGCGRRIGTGLTGVFAAVEEAIILEDDCLPQPAFFPWCVELLARYRTDSRVGVVGATSFQPKDVTGGSGCYFSRYPHCWGWATWRRAWAAYDHPMQGWPEVKRSGWLRTYLGSAREARYWEEIFDRVMAGEIDTWDYRWVYACWRRGFLTVLPARSLVTNIGFGVAATHTQKAALGLLPESPAAPLDLGHPPEVVRHVAADRYTYLYHYHPTLWLRLGRKLRALAGAG